MSESKHTPGPWRVGHNSSEIIADHPTHSGADSASNVAAYGGYLIAESVASSNSRLIAAAPDLLAVCELIRDRLAYLRGLWGDEGVTRATCDQLTTAIQRATEGK